MDKPTRPQREALAAGLRDLKPIPWARAREMGFPVNVPNGADEEGEAESRG